jgi:hypothetical protein
MKKPILKRSGFEIRQTKREWRRFWNSDHLKANKVLSITFFVPTEIAYSNMTRVAARRPVGWPVEIRHGIVELRDLT